MFQTNCLAAAIAGPVTHVVDFVGGMLLVDALKTAERRMRIAGLAQDTEDRYRDEGLAFIAWFRDAHRREPALADLTTPMADSYLLDRLADADDRGTPWAVATLRHHASQLRALGGYPAEANALPGNPLADLRNGKIKRLRPWRTGDALSDEDLAAIVGALDPASSYDVVTRAIVALGYEAGPRTSELTALLVEDFRIAMVANRELGPIVTIRQPAKTSPERVLPLGVRAEDALRAAIGCRTSGPLFPGRNGRAMTVHGMRARLTRAGKRADVVLHPQRLRRSAASSQAAYGALSGHLDRVFGWVPDPRDVQSGHYTIPTIEQLLFAHQARLSPLDRLELRLVANGKPRVL